MGIIISVEILIDFVEEIAFNLKFPFQIFMKTVNPVI